MKLTTVRSITNQMSGQHDRLLLKVPQHHKFV
jgi:hypothetical protein